MKKLSIKNSIYNFCFLAFMLLMFTTTKAQNSIQIKGFVKSTEGNYLSNATIILHPKNSTDSLKTITNENGAFSLNTKQMGDFSISVTYIGFDKKESYYTQKEENGIIDVGLISLIPGSNMLSNVTLEAQKIQIKEDTVSYVVDSTMYRKNDNVEAILKNLPGVQVDKDGTVTAQGKQVTKVKVNGKEFFNGDVTTATREINADMVDKIQIIDDYGDQAAFTGIKDGDPSKTMNIQLKKDKNKGYFGNVTAAGGTDTRYLTSLSINKFNNDQQISILGNLNNINSNLFNFGNGGGNAMMGGMMRSMGIGRGGGGIGAVIGTGNNNEGLNTLNSIGINYRDTWGSKVEVYGSYSFTDKETKTLKNSTQQTFFQDKTSTYIQQSDNNNLADNQRFSFNVEYKIDSMNYLKFNPTVTYNITNYISYSDFLSQINQSKISDGSINDSYITISPNLSGNLLYNHRFKKRGRTFSLNINGGNAENNGDEQLDNLSQFYNPGGISIQQYQYQHILQGNQNYNYGGKISFTEPLSKKRYLEFNYSYNLQYQDNNRKVYKVDTLNGNETYLDSLSNIYNNNYTTNRIGINIRTTEKKYNYTIGFSAQPAKSETNSITSGSQYLNNLINFYPVVRFAYNFSKSRSLNINYNGNSNQPTNAQLQPVTDRSNQQFITKGNPNVKPEFTNTFSMRYNNFDFISGNVFFGNLSASFTQDKIVNSTKLLRGGIQETTYENANGYYTLFGFYNISKPIQNRKYVFNLGGNAAYNNNISFLRDSIDQKTKNNSKNLVLGQRFSTDIKIKKWLETTISANYSLNNTVNTVASELNSNTITWTISHNSRVFLPRNYILSYDVEKSFNIGYSSNTNANPLIVNTVLEKQLLKKKNLSIKVQGLDLLNQNIGISRTVNSLGYTDTKSNKLGRYFMLSLVWRLNKFFGETTGGMQMPFPGGEMKGMRMPGM